MPQRVEKNGGRTWVCPALFAKKPRVWEPPNEVVAWYFMVIPGFFLFSLFFLGGFWVPDLWRSMAGFSVRRIVRRCQDHFDVYSILKVCCSLDLIFPMLQSFKDTH